MFGRVRASPLPVEWLEMERSNSKHFKDDSLSIYEATLVKLKQGSQRSPSLEHNMIAASKDMMDCESNGMNISQDSSEVSGSNGMSTCNGDSSPTSSSSSSPNQEHEKGRQVSIQFLFSRYNSSHHKQGSPFNESEIVENRSSMNSSASSCDSDSIRGKR